MDAGSTEYSGGCTKTPKTASVDVTFAHKLTKEWEEKDWGKNFCIDLVVKWPNSQHLGDPIRGMVICGKHRYEQMKHVWDTISGSDGFHVQVCKVNMAVSNRPPDM